MDTYQINLEITLEAGGRAALDVLNIYGTMIVTDIEETAWNLCGCDDDLMAGRFTGLELDQWRVRNKCGEYIVVIDGRFSVQAESELAIEQIVEDYMDGFSDCLARAENSYFSRTGMRIQFNSDFSNWAMKIK